MVRPGNGGGIGGRTIVPKSAGTTLGEPVPVVSLDIAISSQVSDGCLSTTGSGEKQDTIALHWGRAPRRIAFVVFIGRQGDCKVVSELST